MMKTEIATTKWGEIEFYSEDSFVGRSLREYKFYSMGEIELFQKALRPGTVAIDAGANIGALTIPMARMAQYVFAFEPQPENFFLLMANARRNDLDNLWVRHTALGREASTTMVPYLGEWPLDNFGGIVTGMGTYPVAVETIDDVVKNLNISRIDFIKADVEGKELDVFMGAAATIEKHRPVLYFENDHKDKSDDLLPFLKRLKYRMYWHITKLNLGADHNIWEKEYASFNVLGLPNESPVRITDQVEIDVPG